MSVAIYILAQVQKLTPSLFSSISSLFYSIYFMLTRDCHSSAVPDVMINTEVWVPPGYQYNIWIEHGLVDDAGTITTHGR